MALKTFANPHISHPLGPEGLALTERDEIISWSNTDGIRLHDLGSGRRLWRYPFLDQVAVAPVARLFFCFENGKFTGHRFEDREVVSHWEHPESRVHSLAADPGGRYLVVCGEDKESWLYDTSNGQCLVRHSGCRASLWHCAFSDDGQWLALAGDKTVRVYRPLESKPLLQLKGHKDKVLRLHFVSHELLWSATEYEKERRLWKLPEGSCLDENPPWMRITDSGKVVRPALKPGLRAEVEGDIHSLVEHASLQKACCDSRYIALSCLYEMRIRIYPWKDLPLERDYGPGHIAVPTDLALHAGGLLSSGGNLILRHPDSGDVLQCWEPEDRANQITVSADETLCAYFVNYELRLRRRPQAEVESKVHRLASWDLLLSTKGEHSVYQGWLHFSGDGRYLISRSEGSRRSLRSTWSAWDTRDGRLLWTLKEWVQDGLLRFHPDSQSFYCIDEFYLARYCVRTGSILKRIHLPGSSFAPQIRTFSADFSTAVGYFGDHSLWVWKVDAEMESCEAYEFPFLEPQKFTPSRIALSADGARLAVGRNTTVDILDLSARTLQTSLSIESQGPMNWDGPRLAVAHRDGSLTIWDGQSWP